MLLATYDHGLDVNIHTYGSVLTGVMTGVWLALVVDAAIPSVVGTTCTPSPVVGVEFSPEAAGAEEGTDETDAEPAALAAAEGRAEDDRELEPVANATAGEVTVREPE